MSTLTERALEAHRQQQERRAAREAEQARQEAAKRDEQERIAGWAERTIRAHLATQELVPQGAGTTVHRAGWSGQARQPCGSLVVEHDGLLLHGEIEDRPVNGRVIVLVHLVREVDGEHGVRYERVGPAGSLGLLGGTLARAAEGASA